MNNYPLIRFVILFITGIAAQSILKTSLHTLIIIFILLLMLIIILLFLKRASFEFPKNLSMYTAVIFSGAIYSGMYNQTEVTYPFNEPKYSNAAVMGTVSRIELKRDARINLYLTGKSFVIGEKTYTGEYSLYCSVYDVNKKTARLFDKLSIGDEVKISGILQRPRGERNPGEFDYEKYLNSKGISALLTVYEADSVRIISKGVSHLKNLILEIRKEIDDKILSLHNKTTSALLRGLILADRSLIDYQINDYFINAGVVHVLSVSGLHVGYIVLIFIILFKRFGIYTRTFLTFIGLISYMIITGADAPVFRSTVMALILLAAPLTGRDYYSLNSLSLAAFLILLINPHDLFNPSFQLSFSAILSLIILYPPLKGFIDTLNIRSKIIHWFLIFCVTSIAAQLGTLPFTLTYFHRLSISSLAANLIVIPLSGAIVALGIFTVIAGSVSLWFASIFASANELMTYFLYWFVKILGKGEYSYLSINQFSVYDAVIFYLALFFIFIVFKKIIKPASRIIAVSLSILVMVSLMRLDNHELMPEKILSVMAVDVGQGDAFLIRFPNGKTSLIDAGNKTPYFDNGERIIIPLLNRLGIDTLDYGFISHVDADHYKGFEALVKERRINRIYKPLPDSSSPPDREFEILLRACKYTPVYYSKEAIVIENARIYVLNDTINNYFGNRKSNDRSGMLKLVFGGTSILFTGDAGIEVENDYRKKYGSFLKSDVLKIGHHGSRSSTGEHFLKEVDPEFALISAGIKNKFGHPSKSIVERLNSKKIKILRTDEKGAILLRSDGREIKNINWKDIGAVSNF